MEHGQSRAPLSVHDSIIFHSVFCVVIISPLLYICLDAAYCQVAVDVITKVEHFGSSPASESQELIKVSLQQSDTQNQPCVLSQCMLESFFQNIQLASQGHFLAQHLFVDLPFFQPVNPVPQQCTFVRHSPERSRKE